MTRSKRIRPVVELAEHRKLDAAKLLGQGRTLLELQEQRLLELLGYREEYSRKFQQSCGRGIGAVKLNEYRIFLTRLDDAIRQQRQLVGQACAECEKRLQGWLESRTRASALDKVMVRYRHEEFRQVERREQKEQDEHAARPRRKI